MAAEVEIVNMASQQKFKTRSKVHFHPTMKCVQMYDGSVEKRHMTCSDEVLLQLQTLQLEGLHSMGFL